MGRSLTNSFQIAYALEESLGVLPTTPAWKLLEPNEITTFGSVITTTARNPISKTRQRRKGVPTDLDSAVELGLDLTMDHFIDFVESFLFSSFKGPIVFTPTAATSTAYTVAASGDLVANTLVYARGFSTTANNGLKVVDTGSIATSIEIVGGLTAEASPPNIVKVEIAGVRGATGDIEIDVDGNIISTALDFTTLDLNVGQQLFVGGDAAANSFAVTANRGYARIALIETNKITLNKTSSTFAIDDGATKAIDLYFGRYVRNVAVDHADYLEQSIQFEGAYENLQNPTGTGDKYAYAKGNYANQLSFELPLADIAKLTVGFVGTDTASPSTTRASEAANAKLPLRTEGFNTTEDIARLRIQEVDETGLTTDFKSLTMVLNNNVTPEKVLANFGAKYLNTGIFEIDMDTQLVFTDSDIVSAVRNNTTLTMDFSVRNGDGAIAVDIPSIILTGDQQEFPVNESILITTTAQAFGDTTLGYSMSVSLFPYAPAS